MVSTIKQARDHSVSNPVKRKYACSRYSSITNLSSLIDSDSDGLQQITKNLIDEYGLTGRFERWSFLQKLLENELPLLDIENVIIAVFNGYLLHGPSVGDKELYDAKSDDDNEGLPSPILDDEMRDLIQQVIDGIVCIRDVTDSAECRFLNLFVEPPIDYELEVLMGTLLDKKTDVATKSSEGIYPKALALITQLEQLLPDPIEEEEAHKSAWDLVIELHGREGVRIREEALQRDGDNITKENLSWKTLCCIGRVLVHYDFLTKGILLD